MLKMLAPANETPPWGDCLGEGVPLREPREPGRARDHPAEPLSPAGVKHSRNYSDTVRRQYAERVQAAASARRAGVALGNSSTMAGGA